MHFVLTYEYTDDYLARRDEFRAEHLRRAWEAVDRGELLLGGALGDPPSDAMLVFEAADASVPEAFAQGDPYLAGGLIRAWRVTPWTTVVGRTAASPVHPA